jgi:UTP:GlnB (protein PII) uridylyltransferase
LMLAVSELAHEAQLAPIIGAFVAGIALRSSRSAERVHRELAPVGHLLVPVFFLQIGMEADVAQFRSTTVLGYSAVLLAVGIGGKLVSPLALGRGHGDRLLMGIGMVPRGEVGLIFATIGLQQAVFGDDVYATLLLVVIASTVVSPPFLRWRINMMRARATRVDRAASAQVDSWFTMTGDHKFDLVADPPVALALTVTFEAALLGRHRAPGERLLDWIGTLPDESLPWDRAARHKFTELLELGDARSWRFLAVTGVLERALPELQPALGHRHRDLSDLDPIGVYSLTCLGRLRELDERNDLAHPDRVALAAFLLDMLPDDSLIVAAPQVLARMGVNEAVSASVAAMLRDRDLLVHAARRVEFLSEENVAQFALHLDSAEQAKELFIIAVISSELESWELERLRELHRRIGQMLEPDSVSGSEMGGLVATRRAEAMSQAPDARVRDRIAVAPVAYVLATDVAGLVRHASLCEPPLFRRQVRVHVEALSEESWQIDFAAHDAVGLLARESRVLADLGHEVLAAVAVTWGDHQAVSSFHTRAVNAAEPADLQRRLIAQFDEPLALRGLDGVRVLFDDQSSPWHTLCRVEAPNRAGLLAAVTAAFAAAGVNVHSARVVTEGDSAIDVFELNQGEAIKISAEARQAIEHALRTGTSVTPRRWFRRR